MGVTAMSIRKRYKGGVNMLEFMKGVSINEYCLPERFRDCVPNLLAFNCYTPMAICLEAMLKLDYLRYAEEKHIPFSIYDFDDPDTRSDYSLGKLLKLKPFTSWLQERYGIDQDDIITLQALNKQNNDYKHSLQKIRKIKNPAQKKEIVKTFYEFSAKYYEHRSSKQAPPWPIEEYEKLVAPESEDVITRGEAIRKGVRQ